MAKYSTDWSGVPDTCETASVQKTETVKSARVIHLAKAGIREGLKAGDEVIVYPPPGVSEGVRIRRFTPRPQP